MAFAPYDMRLRICYIRLFIFVCFLFLVTRICPTTLLLHEEHDYNEDKDFIFHESPNHRRHTGDDDIPWIFIFLHSSWRTGIFSRLILSFVICFQRASRNHMNDDLLARRWTFAVPDRVHSY